MKTRVATSLIALVLAGCASSAGQFSADTGADVAAVDAVAADAPPTGRACHSAAECAHDEVCVFAATSSCGDEVGQCTPQPNCRATQAFCACDNNTTYRDCVPTRPTLSDHACHMSIPVCPTTPVMIDSEGRCIEPDGSAPPLPSCCIGAFDCDDRDVARDSRPPECGPVWVPSVTGRGSERSYGPCVPESRCAPMQCDPNDPSIPCSSWAVCDLATHLCVHR